MKSRACVLLAVGLAAAATFSIWPEYRGHTFLPLLASMYDSGSRVLLVVAVLVVIERFVDRVI